MALDKTAIDDVTFSISRCLTIMAYMIHSLPILRVPEQLLIPSMRNNVVHHVRG